LGWSCLLEPQRFDRVHRRRPDRGNRSPEQAGQEPREKDEQRVEPVNLVGHLDEVVHGRVPDDDAGGAAEPVVNLVDVADDHPGDEHAEAGPDGADDEPVANPQPRDPAGARAQGPQDADVLGFFGDHRPEDRQDEEDIGEADDAEDEQDEPGFLFDGRDERGVLLLPGLDENRVRVGDIGGVIVGKLGVDLIADLGEIGGFDAINGPDEDAGHAGGVYADDLGRGGNLAAGLGVDDGVEGSGGLGFEGLVHVEHGLEGIEPGEDDLGVGLEDTALELVGDGELAGDGVGESAVGIQGEQGDGEVAVTGHEDIFVNDRAVGLRPARESRDIPPPGLTHVEPGDLDTGDDGWLGAAGFVAGEGQAVVVDGGEKVGGGVLGQADISAGFVLGGGRIEGAPEEGGGVIGDSVEGWAVYSLDGDSHESVVGQADHAEGFDDGGCGCDFGAGFEPGDQIVVMGEADVGPGDGDIADEGSARVLERLEEPAHDRPGHEDGGRRKQDRDERQQRHDLAGQVAAVEQGLVQGSPRGRNADGAESLSAFDRAQAQDLEDDVGGEQGGVAGEVAVGEDFDDIGPGDFEPRERAEDSQGLGGTQPADTRGAGARCEGRVDDIDIEGDVRGLVADGFEHGGQRCRAGVIPIFAGDDGDAVVFGVFEVGRRVEWAFDADRDHAFGVDELAFDGPDEWRGMAPALAPDGIDGVEVAVEVDEREPGVW
jgi:hypothetical protein